MILKLKMILILLVFSVSSLAATEIVIVRGVPIESGFYNYLNAINLNSYDMNNILKGYGRYGMANAIAQTARGMWINRCDSKLGKAGGIKTVCIRDANFERLSNWNNECQSLTNEEWGLSATWSPSDDIQLSGSLGQSNPKYDKCVHRLELSYRVDLDVCDADYDKTIKNAHEICKGSGVGPWK